MKSIISEFETWLKKVDPNHVFEGISGSGHRRIYRLSNGAEASISSSPSKYSALANAKADTRRALGVQSDSPNAAKYRGMRGGDGYDGTRTRQTGGWAMPKGVINAQRRADQIKLEMVQLDPIRNQSRLLNLARELVDLKEETAAYGVILDIEVTK